MFFPPQSCYVQDNHPQKQEWKRTVKTQLQNEYSVWAFQLLMSLKMGIEYPFPKKAKKDKSDLDFQSAMWTAVHRGVHCYGNTLSFSHFHHNACTHWMGGDNQICLFEACLLILQTPISPPGVVIKMPLEMSSQGPKKEKLTSFLLELL